jgi:hypothetical protein
MRGFQPLWRKLQCVIRHVCLSRILADLWIRRLMFHRPDHREFLCMQRPGHLRPGDAELRRQQLLQQCKLHVQGDQWQLHQQCAMRKRQLFQRHLLRRQSDRLQRHLLRQRADGLR